MLYRKRIPLGILTVLQDSDWFEEELDKFAPRSSWVLADKQRTCNKSFRSAKNENTH